MIRLILITALLVSVQVVQGADPHTQPNAAQVPDAHAPSDSGIGTITVRAVQGTAGGPAVAGDKVIVELTGHGLRAQRIEAYAASEVLAGKEINLVLSGLSRPLRPDEVASALPYFPRILAAIGSVVLLIPCIVILLRRPSRAEV